MKKTAAALVLLSVVLCTTAVATKPHIVFILVEYVTVLLCSTVRPPFCLPRPHCLPPFVPPTRIQRLRPHGYRLPQREVRQLVAHTYSRPTCRTRRETGELLRPTDMYPDPVAAHERALPDSHGAAAWRHSSYDAIGIVNGHRYLAKLSMWRWRLRCAAGRQPHCARRAGLQMPFGGQVGEW